VARRGEVTSLKLGGLTSVSAQPWGIKAALAKSDKTRGCPTFIESS
jgi:hypothetical protein